MALVLDQDDGSWVHHQQRVQQLTANTDRHPKGARHEKGPTLTALIFTPVSVCVGGSRIQHSLSSMPELQR